MSLTEIRIHGRGGQGGVTLAKIIAMARHLTGESVQAFGIYAAERSGAPVQAFVRYDKKLVTNRNQIYEPDHIVVLDPSLISPAIVAGLKSGGWILLNSSDSIEHHSATPAFKGYRLAIVDATAIAREFGLGTKSVPIVNTALSGAVAQILSMDLALVIRALDKMGFQGDNQDAAKKAFHSTHIAPANAMCVDTRKPLASRKRVKGLLNGNTGATPIIRTGQWASQKPGEKESIPPCNFICPAGNNVQAFIAALAKDDPDKALSILLETTPLPSICGRVCPGFCMEQCNRKDFDGAVNVRALERYAGDHGQTAIPVPKRRSERVAVVGSGPSGLSASFHLVRLGYDVTLFEARSELGGLLRTGIPAYRLPRDVLDREVARILNLGVKAVLARRINTDELAKLEAEFTAVVLATGLQKSHSIDLGISSDRILQGIDFLELIRTGKINTLDQEITVIGGGNTAIDAARSAIRKGARKVTILYRRTRDEMPAIGEEIDEALDEGVKIEFLTSPIKAKMSGARIGLTCRRMKLGEADSGGRRKPIELAGSDFEIVCDKAVLALGQFADVSELLKDSKIERSVKTSSGKLVMLTGDLLTNEGTVTAAIGCGKKAALTIHEKINGEKRIYEKPPESEVIRINRIKLHLFEKQLPQRESALVMDERRNTFKEVRSAIGIDEAKRCLSCGVCNECNRCITYCPDTVLKRIGEDLVFDYDYCKGCGVCASECPRAVILMKGV